VLALGIFLLTLFEFLAYCGLGAWLCLTRGLPVWEVVLVALGIALGIRAAITAYLFVFAEAFTGPRPEGMRIGPAAALAMFLRELAALCTLYTVMHTLDRWLGLPDPYADPDDRDPPVLLLHGFFCNSAFWWPLRRALRRSGYRNVYTQSLEPVFGDIEDLGELAAQKIESILAAAGAEQLVVVAHSMGGLAMRAYLRRHGCRRVAKLIMLGTPHQGTAHARLVRGLGRNLRQMCPGSVWLAELNTLPPPGLPMVNVWSWHDSIVTPPDYARLEGAHNLELAGLGHLEMALSPRIREIVLREVRAV
jgi:triacylglycerol lipase